MIYRPFRQYSRVDPKSKRKSASDLELEAALAKQKEDFRLTAEEQQKEIKALAAGLRATGIANPEAERAACNSLASASNAGSRQ
jgi:hypothetical protein